MRTFARFALLVLVLAGAVVVGVTAYNAGVTAGLAQNGAVVVNPGGDPVGPYVGYGWAGYGWPGFGFFGFFGFLFFLLILFGLIGAATGHGRRGPGGPGRGHDGRHDWRGGPWEARAREAHDAWHRGEAGQPADPSSPAAADR